MKLDDFDFDLPEDRIATRPAQPRSSARLMVAGRTGVADAWVTDLPGFLRPGDRLVLNDTRVIPARLTGLRRRDTGQGVVEAKIEATLLSPTPNGDWAALLKPLRKVKIGEVIHFGESLQAELLRVEAGQGVLQSLVTLRAFPKTDIAQKVNAAVLNAGDGRHELFKSTQAFDSGTHRRQHGFPERRRS